MLRSTRLTIASTEPPEGSATTENSPSKVNVDAKGKAKAKAPSSSSLSSEMVYDYLDGSVSDIALRSSILESYEQFKVCPSALFWSSRLNVYPQLKFGSFRSIFETMWQQALELILERFFTVWAWSWDLEKINNFGPHLGMLVLFFIATLVLGYV